MNTTNPLMQLVPIAFLALFALLCWLTWRTVRAAWLAHASPEGLQKRQLKDARRDYLMHQLAAEQHAAAAAGLMTTINRLSGPTFTPGEGTRLVSVTVHGTGGASGRAVGVGGTGQPPETYSAHDQREDIPK